MAGQRWNRLRLRDEAAELADEQGFAAVTPSALARRVGVTVPSLYTHVSDAKDLRVCIALLALEEMAGSVSQALAGRAGADALSALANALRDYARAHPGRWDAAKLRLDDATARDSAGPRLAALMRDALLGYDLREDDVTHAVRLVGSTVRGFVDLEGAGSFDHSAPDPGLTWVRILHSLDAQLRSWRLTDHGGTT